MEYLDSKPARDIAKVPKVGNSEPSKASSPINKLFFNKPEILALRPFICPDAMRTPNAIAKSSPALLLRIVAGARFTTIRLIGNS